MRVKNNMAQKLIRQGRHKPKVIAIVGPTASGKTSLSIFLAQKIGGEVVSADSRQVYKGLDIGTGKVTKKEMGGIPHHLLDVAHPKKVFTADDFVTLGRNAIEKVLHNGHTPIVVGGTGFYVDSLLGKMAFPNVPPNEKLRARLEKKSAQELFLLLKKKDPRRAGTIESKNKRRLIRALEIAETLGTNPVPTLEQTYEVLWLGIWPNEKVLQKNIRTRLLERIRAGMVEEAVRLHAQGLSYKRMKALGLEYRFLAELLQGEISPEEFVEGLERAIRRYAKNQIRWFKRNKDILWISYTSANTIISKALIEVKRFVAQ